MKKDSVIDSPTKEATVGDSVSVTCLSGNPVGKLCSYSTENDECKVHVEIDGKTHVLFAKISDLIAFPVNSGKWMLMNFGKSQILPSGITDMVDSTIDKVRTILDNGGEDKDALTVFTEYAKVTIDDEGRFVPSPCVFVRQDDDLGIAMMHSQNTEVVNIIKKIMLEQNPKELIFALSAANFDGSGLSIKTYKFIATIFHFKDGVWNAGVMAHNKKGEKIGEILWDGPEWKKGAMNLLESTGLKSIGKSKGTGYKGRINIQEYSENKSGYFYEGSINFNKLDKTVQTYLTENKLDINNKKEIVRFLKIKGYKLDVQDEGDFTLAKLIGPNNFSCEIPKRRSIMRAYLETIEAMIANELNTNKK